MIVKYQNDISAKELSETLSRLEVSTKPFSIRDQFDIAALPLLPFHLFALFPFFLLISRLFSHFFHSAHKLIPR